MPSLGTDMEAGTLVEWLVHPGAHVKRGDIIAVVETEKGIIDIEVFETGVVERLLVEPGTEVLWARCSPPFVLSEHQQQPRQEEERRQAQWLPQREQSRRASRATQPHVRRSNRPETSRRCPPRASARESHLWRVNWPLNSLLI